MRALLGPRLLDQQLSYSIEERKKSSLYTNDIITDNGRNEKRIFLIIKGKMKVDPYPSDIP
jgi:hypothetical protein